MSTCSGLHYILPFANKIFLDLANGKNCRIDSFGADRDNIQSLPGGQAQSVLSGDRNTDNVRVAVQCYHLLFGHGRHGVAVLSVTQRAADFTVTARESTKK